MCKSIGGMANINAQEVQTIACQIPPVTLQLELASRIENLENVRTPFDTSKSLVLHKHAIIIEPRPEGAGQN